MKSVIMSPKGFTLVVILVSMMCGTVMSDVQPAGIGPSNNTSHSQSSSSQSGTVSTTSPKKTDTSRSQVSVHSDATAPKVEDKLGNTSQPDCGTKPCLPKSKNSSSNANEPFPIDAEHISDESDDLSKKLNPEALMRGFYVFVGLSIIVMAYIAWKRYEDDSVYFFLVLLILLCINMQNLLLL